MESLTEFVAAGTATTQVPLSIICLKNLKMWMPDFEAQFLLFIHLLMGEKKVRSDTVSGLSKLKTLKLDDCAELELLPEMPTNLFTLSAVNCTSLKSVSKFRHVPRLLLTNCRKIEEISGLDKLRSAGTIHMEWCYSLSSYFKVFLFQDWCGYGYGKIFLPGSDILDWFSYQNVSPSLSFQMPPFPGCKLQGFMECIVYSSKSDTKEPQPFPIVTITNKRNQSIFTHYAGTYENIPVTVEDHMRMFHSPPFITN